MSEQRALESACLAPEVIAMYLDDRLSGAERESVEAHLASCDDCRELLVMSFRALEAIELDATATPMASETTPAAAGAVIPIREDRRRIVWTVGGLLAAAAVLVLIVKLDPAWWRSLTGRPGVTKELEALVAAAGTQNRFVEPRLTGGFKWGAMRSPTRSASATRRLHPDVNLAIAEIDTAAESGGTDQRHAQGIARILQGDLDAAIQTLGRAAAQGGSSSAHILTDLSAAFFARWRERGDDNDAKQALEAAQRAVDADATIPEAWFNLALAREAVGDTRRAREAWTRYLSVDADPQPEWREEARRHLAPIPP